MDYSDRAAADTAPLMPPPTITIRQSKTSAGSRAKLVARGVILQSVLGRQTNANRCKALGGDQSSGRAVASSSAQHPVGGPNARSGPSKRTR